VIRELPNGWEEANDDGCHWTTTQLCRPSYRGHPEGETHFAFPIEFAAIRRRTVSTTHLSMQSTYVCVYLYRYRSPPSPPGVLASRMACMGTLLFLPCNVPLYSQYWTFS